MRPNWLGRQPRWAGAQGATSFLRTSFVAIVAALGLGVLGPGCGGGDSATSNAPSGSRGDDSVREQCNEGGGRTVRAVDVNNDGSPDIRHVYEGSVERCAQYDMNFDGMVDVTRFFGPDGVTAIREEHDLDFDGRLDQIAYIENGIVARSELDTNFDNVIDTWLWCQGNLLERSERDRNHNGRPDTWEMFENGLIVEARYDENNDGQPDRWEMFQDGRLSQVRRDTDVDGEADQSEDIPADSAGQQEPALTCDGTEPPPPPSPPPPVETAPAPTTPATGADAGAPFGAVPPADSTEGSTP